MKKVRFVGITLLAFAMLFALASCSKNNDTTTAATSTPTATTTPAASTTSAASAATTTAAPAKELTIDEKLIANQWCYKFSAEGYGDFAFFFKFYEADPVLGKVFYAGLSNNRQNFAGTYDLVKEPYGYKAYNTREEEQADDDHVAYTAVGTADYTIVLKDWDGKEIGRMGFDGEKLYNAQDKDTAIVYSAGSTPFVYNKNDASFASTIAGEMPVVVFSYTAFDDVTSTIQINHNHSYTDLVAAMIEGTWTSSQSADGSITFDLTPYDSLDTPATLVVSADKKTATYTADGEDPIEMGIPLPDVTTEYSFQGKTPTAYGRDADLVLDCLSDGTFTLTISVFGNSQTLDQGTWSVNAAHKFTFNCDNAGTIESTIVDRNVHVSYSTTHAQLGELSSDLALVN